MKKSTQNIIIAVAILVTVLYVLSSGWYLKRRWAKPVRAKVSDTIPDTIGTGERQDSLIKVFVNQGEIKEGRKVPIDTPYEKVPQIALKEVDSVYWIADGFTVRDTVNGLYEIRN